MNVILRPAVEKDFPAVSEILGPWIRKDSSIGEMFSNQWASTPSETAQSHVLEVDGTVRCISLWTVENSDHVRLVALGFTPEARRSGDDVRFLREEIAGWAELGVDRVTIRVPEDLAVRLVPCLRNCGFMYEGMCSSCCGDARPWAAFCKHFLYRTIQESEVFDFFQDILLSLGHEVRSDEQGFTYRIRSEFRLPFIFNSWHRVTKSGNDLIVQPPARILEWDELETLFYPLQIQEENRKPLLVPLERKTAAGLIEMPSAGNHQTGLFDLNTKGSAKAFSKESFAFVDAAAVQGIRKGLPLLFYIGRMGAVGTARVADWTLQDGENMLRALQEKGWMEDGDAMQHNAASWPKSGKMLAVKFHWYQPLRRLIKLEEIRILDKSFAPQRVRYLSPDLFQSILMRAHHPPRLDGV